MTRRAKQKIRESQKPTAAPAPADMIDGIPDASAHRSRWKYAVIAAVFLAWVGFLVYCALAGGV